MIVPDYWAEAKQTMKKDGKQKTLQRFGWSDESLQHAHIHAQKRLAEAITQWEAGEEIISRERKTPYGENGLPIREEIVEKTDDYVITRNAYGSLCLNVENICFIDIDSENYLSFWDDLGFWLNLIIAIGAIVLAISVSLVYLLLLFLMLLLHYFIKFIKKSLVPKIKETLNKKLETIVEENPELCLRLYQTPLGFRVLLMNGEYYAGDKMVEQCFSVLNADKIYIHMCQLQQCFRARISSKPWRIGMEDHIKPRRASVPFEPEKLLERKKWVDIYNKKAKDFSSCQFVKEYGKGNYHMKAVRIRDVHDDFCRASIKLPMA